MDWTGSWGTCYWAGEEGSTESQNLKLAGGFERYSAMPDSVSLPFLSARRFMM